MQISPINVNTYRPMTRKNTINFRGDEEKAEKKEGGAKKTNPKMSKRLQQLIKFGLSGLAWLGIVTGTKAGINQIDVMVNGDPYNIIMPGIQASETAKKNVANQMGIDNNLVVEDGNENLLVLNAFTHQNELLEEARENVRREGYKANKAGNKNNKDLAKAYNRLNKLNEIIKLQNELCSFGEDEEEKVYMLFKQDTTVGEAEDLLGLEAGSIAKYSENGDTEQGDWATGYGNTKIKAGTMLKVQKDDFVPLEKFDAIK